ncbi:MAG: hypothetical protein BGO45_15760 [Microbacterium sp. 71-36]|uniref:hypothetical protein n=2 Tax=Microbacterium TaxID=33882 RepID=UPI00086E0665|nr:hypothetical protein [Microbacterium sp. 71-36]MBN9212398.1 hypothetical protein [Microbacterium sp.]ODT36067.1 MAG: hypothetical protein ABS60_16775 [Microbacterium sp. SCN 71-17]ODU51588.1 MAG: hypothetical protein ABT07_02245 [Microbacterium sp. SCN 70-10]OJV78123.1 MAG: hypothetical protein BGO45_15760 [Microbacterium sp. 71-36]
MNGGKTMIRTQMAVGDTVFALAQGQDIEALKARIESAVDRGGRFESFVVVGDREVSVLFSSHTSVLFSVETVAFDEREDGDADLPYGGFFDE